jgi:dTMP kinase
VLISFEGIDGCGKTTQIDLLKNYLKIKNTAFHIFREPGGTVISEKIRNLLLHEMDELNPVTELLLFSAARSQLLTDKVIPLLENNELVILDRFYDSTTAYQGYGRGSAGLDQIMELNILASHGTAPDLTFYLRIDPEAASQRTTGGVKDRMENSGIDFFKKVCEGYDKLAEMEDRFVVIDASQSPEEIHSDIIRKLESHI